MSAGAGTVGEAYRYWFALKTGSGAPRTGAAGAVTATVRNPGNTASDSPAVTEVGATGLYFIDVAAAFTTTHGAGEYGVQLNVTTAPRDQFAESIRFHTRDIDDLAQPGDAMDLVIDAVDADAVATSGANEIRDSILSDSTPFNGADVAAILVDTGTTLPADIAGVQSDTDDIQTRLPAALVGGRMDSDVGAMQAGVVDAAAIDTDAIDADALATDGLQEIADHLETNGTNPHGTGAWTGTVLTQQQIRDSMKLTPTVGAPAAGSVDEHLDDILADTAAIEPLVTTNIDATISSRSDFDETTDPVELLDSGGAAGTAADELVSDVDAALTTAHGAGAWTSGTGLTPQQARDAMKLAPTAGAPAAGSIDEALDNIEADTAAIEPLTTANLDATVSSRSSHSAADVDTTLTAAHGAGSWNPATGFATPGDVTAAVTSIIAAISASETAIRGADGDDLKAISDQLDAGVVLNATDTARLLDVFRMLGLDSANPMVIDATEHNAGSGTLVVGIGIVGNVITLTRVP